MTVYDSTFYDVIRSGCQDSAEVVVPVLIDRFKPSTVVDVGCGEGWWAHEFAQHGCSVVGVDGSHVESSILGGRFVVADLSEPLPELVRFDMSICLEVAEHLPASRSTSFVADLCRLADIVVFSAATPHQGGAGHINCQWPSYWARRFADHGYAVDPSVRWQFWDDDRIEPWYRQNLLVFGRGLDGPGPLDVIHPIIHGWGR